MYSSGVHLMLKYFGCDIPLKFEKYPIVTKITHSHLKKKKITNIKHLRAMELNVESIRKELKLRGDELTQDDIVNVITTTNEKIGSLLYTCKLLTCGDKTGYVLYYSLHNLMTKNTLKWKKSTFDKILNMLTN